MKKRMYMCSKDHRHRIYVDAEPEQSAEATLPPGWQIRDGETYCEACAKKFRIV